MNVVAIVKYVFSLVGVVLFTATYFAYKSSASLVSEGLRAQGVVVGMSLSSSEGDTMYRPVVAFSAHDGQKIEFVSLLGTDRPRYSKGARVEVLYRAHNPQSAEIHDFASLWFLVLILGGLATVFGSIGFGICFVQAFEKRKSDAGTARVRYQRSRDPAIHRG